jgi:hypothetical protein
MRFFRPLGPLVATGLITACAPHRALTNDPLCENPFSLASPQLFPRVPNASIPLLGSIVVGVVIDTVSGRGVVGASVGLRRLGSATRESVGNLTDSSGAFVLVLASYGGSFELTVGIGNYQLKRDTVSLEREVDTLSIAMRRGLPLCNIQASSTS